jgi:hypothetical protein
MLSSTLLHFCCRQSRQFNSLSPLLIYGTFLSQCLGFDVMNRETRRSGKNEAVSDAGTTSACLSLMIEQQFNEGEGN